MIFEHIEKLKKQYTDKYVVVDEGRPELKRFRGLTGTVKTVNMSGRALVEFDGYNNIGWYDIDPVFLKVVDAPPPKPVEAKKEKAAAPKAEKAAAGCCTRQGCSCQGCACQAGACQAGGRGRACCGRQVGRRHHRRSQRWQSGCCRRQNRGGSASVSQVPKRRGHSGRGSYQTGGCPAGRQGRSSSGPPPKPAAAPAAKVDPSKMSVADIVAAAKGKAPAAPAAAAAAAPAAKAAPAKAAPAPKPAPKVQEPPPAAEEPEADARDAGSSGRRGRQKIEEGCHHNGRRTNCLLPQGRCEVGRIANPSCPSRKVNHELVQPVRSQHAASKKLRRPIGPDHHPDRHGRAAARVCRHLRRRRLPDSQGRHEAGAAWVELMPTMAAL